MINLHNAFSVSGLSIDDLVGVFAGDDDPRLIDTSGAPVGSAYLQTDGTIWSRRPEGWVRLVAHGVPYRQRFLTGLLGTAGLDAGTTNLRVNGFITNVDAYVAAHPDYDIHIMRLVFLIADSAVVHNRFGNVAGLTVGFDLFAEEAGETTYLLRNVLTGGQLIVKAGGAQLFGNGGEVAEITNWTGTQDAQLVGFDVGAMLPLEGLRIGRGTQDRLVVRIRDNLSQISPAGEFSVRVFGFKKYP